MASPSFIQSSTLTTITITAASATATNPDHAASLHQRLSESQIIGVLAGSMAALFLINVALMFAWDPMKKLWKRWRGREAVPAAGTAERESSVGMGSQAEREDNVMDQRPSS